MKLFNEVFEKKIPKKNYYIVIIGSLITVGLVFLIRCIYLNYKENAINESIFSSENVTQINTDDLDFALNEMSNAILYVGYTGDYDVYHAEKKLFRELKRKDLLDITVYWNVSDTNNYISLLKNKYSNIQSQITTAPLLIYIKDGEAVEAFCSELKTVDNVALDRLIDKYEIQ